MAVKLAAGDAFHAGIGSVAVVCAAVVVAALRSLVYSHERAVPLTMPFVWSGFQFDGHLTLAVAGLTLTVIEGVWAGVSSKIRTVQRIRAHARSIREAN